MADTPIINPDENIRALMEFVSTCRDDKCAVPQKHPFYPTPEKPPLYYGKRPCMPVVPTNLNTGKLMIIGEYPNCRFGSETKLNPTKEDILKLFPVADVNEPFEGGRYFDAHNNLKYPTYESLDEHYLKPLGINVRADVWLTNINKCYLMTPANITRYQELGWSDPPTQTTLSTDADYYAIAAVCVPRHIPKELQLCQPQLIIVLGGKGYHMVHGSDDFQTPAAVDHSNELFGKVLLRNDTSNPLDKRNSLFRQFNVVHLHHPSLWTYEGSEDKLQQHMTVDIPAVKAFIDSNHIL